MIAVYYHLIDPRDVIFCNNVYFGRGRIIATSFTRGLDPKMSGIKSPYEVFTREADKETVFETIRDKEFPDTPPRMGAIFLFDAADSAEKANAAWWQGQRVILEAEVVRAHRVGKFDASFLNTTKDHWENAARTYWSGSISAQPQIEVLVDGIVQLRGWENYGRPLAPQPHGP